MYSENELHKIVVDAIIRVLKSILNNNCRICLDEEGISYEEIHDHVISELIMHDGFEPVKYQAKWSCFGWPSIVNEDSWRGQRCDALKNIYSEIPKDLRDTIVKRGAEAYKKRYEDRLPALHLK